MERATEFDSVHKWDSRLLHAVLSGASSLPLLAFKSKALV